MITPTQQIVWSIVSRQPIADLSLTSRQPVANQSQPIYNQLAINQLVADFRDSCRRPVPDWSATEKMQFWSYSGCIGCSCFLVARQSPTGCSTCVTALYCLVLLAIDGKAGWQDGRAFVTWPIWNISIFGYLFPQNEYSFMHVWSFTWTGMYVCIILSFMILLFIINRSVFLI